MYLLLTKIIDMNKKFQATKCPNCFRILPLLKKFNRRGEVIKQFYKCKRDKFEMDAAHIN